MIRSIAGDTYHEHFNGLSDFLQTVDSRQAHDFMNPRYGSDESPSMWNGNVSYDQALTLLHTGWLPEAKLMAEKLPISTASSQVKRSMPTYGMVGGQASVPRYLQGIPTNMVDRRPVVVKQKIIKLYRDISFSADISAKEIEDSGIAAVRVIQGLENRGYRVEMNVCFCAYAGGRNLAMSLCIKRPDERISLTKMAFPMIHAAMLRKITFKWLETCPDTPRQFSSGYGIPAIGNLEKLLPKGSFLIKGMRGSDLQASEQYLQELVNKIEGA